MLKFLAQFFTSSFFELLKKDTSESENIGQKFFAHQLFKY